MLQSGIITDWGDGLAPVRGDTMTLINADRCWSNTECDKNDILFCEIIYFNHMLNTDL